jgi:hypothetical protein
LRGNQQMPRARRPLPSPRRAQRSPRRPGHRPAAASSTSRTCRERHLF